MGSSVKKTGTGQPYSETVASTGINGLTTGFSPFINDAARLLSSDRTSSRDQVRENNIDTAIPEYAEKTMKGQGGLTNNKYLIIRADIT